MRIETLKTKLLRLVIETKTLLNLKEDFDEIGASESILANLEFKSGNAWSLVFAILIASIGLHVNSTAVIIGAMLISPLMGSIVGAGFSLAVHDFMNLRKSIINLLYAVAISLLTSSLFFLITPLSSAQSELMARTQPSFYDVLIAFFGGAAGIVASTRKTKGNAIPGVAIATALMPPLCTAGYGMANLDFSIAIGAIYLFLINTTFILISTYIFVRFLGFRITSDRDLAKDKLVHKWMGIGSIAMIIPSLVMAWYLHKKTSFENSAKSFIEQEVAVASVIVGRPSFNFSLSSPEINVKIYGKSLIDAELARLSETLKTKYKLNNTRLVIKSENKEGLDISQLDEKYLTKHDFFKLREDEKARNFENNKNIAEELNTILSQKKIRSFASVSVAGDEGEDFIQINWIKQPAQRDLAKAEEIAYSFLIRQKVRLVHKF